MSSLLRIIIVKTCYGAHAGIDLGGGTLRTQVWWSLCQQTARSGVWICSPRCIAQISKPILLCTSWHSHLRRSIIPANFEQALNAHLL